jgi:hypothetical protein
VGIAWSSGSRASAKMKPPLQAFLAVEARPGTPRDGWGYGLCQPQLKIR